MVTFYCIILQYGILYNMYDLIFHTFKLPVRCAYVVLDNFTALVFQDSETKIILGLIFKPKWVIMCFQNYM